MRGKEVTKTCEDLGRAGNNNAACIKGGKNIINALLIIVFWYPSMTSSYYTHIYHMNHGHFVVCNKYTTLVLSHQKFTGDKLLGVSALTSDSGRIFAVYTPNSHGSYYKYNIYIIYICLQQSVKIVYCNYYVITNHSTNCNLPVPLSV